VDLSGRGYLGFAKVIVRDLKDPDTDDDLYTVSAYNRPLFPYTGLPTVTETHRAAIDGTLVSKVTNAYEQMPTFGAAVNPYLLSSSEIRYDLAGSPLVTTNTSYSQPTVYGNIRVGVVDYTGDGQNHITTTVNTYGEDDPAAWRLGRLTQSQVTQLSGGKSITRVSSFNYSQVTGLLLKETVQPGTAVALIKTYGRDDFGNITTETISGADIATRTTETQYLPSGRFPRVITNAADHKETHEYDPAHGGITSLIGPNGLETQWTYDALGRNATEMRADGTRTNVTYFWCNGTCPTPPSTKAPYLYKIITANTGAPQVIEYFDSLSRKVLTESQAFGEGQWSKVTTQYDDLGRVARVSRPYAGSPSYWMEYAYDETRRLTTETSPTTGTTTTQQAKLTTIVTNDKGQETRDIKNARGLTIETIDAAAMRTVYAYDPVGNLLSVTDSAGNKTTNIYDLRGHKRQTSDPDMGVWKYDYDVLGQLKQQTDAKGQLACFKYDLLGRMTQRIEFAGGAGLTCEAPPVAREQATWVYDTAANGIGQLARETDPGFSRTYVYDAKSRAASTTTTIDGIGYTTSQTYDLLSRVNVISYPTGFAVRHVYRPAGYLEQVQHVNNGQVYWRANSVDVEGHITVETLGNNRVTYRDYAADSGRLTGIKTASTGAVQDLQYQFDVLGNLDSRADLAQGYREDFSYDPLNRLTAVTTVIGSSTVTRRVGYDDLGNIKTKTGTTGTYLYASPRPHAMTGADGDTFGYDANGNMLAGANRTLTWNVANLPTKITQGAIARYFAYGPDRARYKQSLTGSGSTETTHYVGGLYEQLSKGSITTRRHHIYANGQVIAVYSTQNNTQGTVQYLHRDHLGSVDTITNDSGQVIARLSYDAWGKRRASNWSQPPGQLTASFNRGFTGHEHLDDVGLIHMNGRVYHPGLGRFISADPTGQFPKASQSFNRYSYVINNPLSYTDPSGFGFFSELLDIQHKIDPISRNFDHILAKSTTLQSIGGVAAGVASVYFGPWVAAAYSAHLTNIKGGSTGDILKAGAIAGGAAAASGAAGGLGVYGQIAANIAIGTAAGVASGADFEDSFYASAITSVAAAGVAQSGAPPAVGITISATVGGTASQLSGGKFVNGAVTGAFQYALVAAAQSLDDGKFDVTEREAAPGDQAVSIEIEQQLDYRFRRTTLSGTVSGELVSVDLAYARSQGMVSDLGSKKWTPSTLI